MAPCVATFKVSVLFTIYRLFIRFNGVESDGGSICGEVNGANV